jgi:hypothetical protein
MPATCLHTVSNTIDVSTCSSRLYYILRKPIIADTAAVVNNGCRTGCSFAQKVKNESKIAKFRPHNGQKMRQKIDFLGKAEPASGTILQNRYQRPSRVLK